MGALRFALLAACLLAVVAVEASVQPTGLGHALVTETHGMTTVNSALFVANSNEIILAGGDVERRNIFDMTIAGASLLLGTSSTKVLSFDMKIPGTFLHPDGSSSLQARSVGDGGNVHAVVPSGFPTNCVDMALSPSGDVLIVLTDSNLHRYTWDAGSSEFGVAGTETVVGEVAWITWMGNSLVAMGGSAATAHVTEYSTSTLQPLGSALYDDQTVSEPHAPAVGPDGLLYFFDEIFTNMYAIFTTDMGQATPTRFGPATFDEKMKETVFALRRDPGASTAVDSVLVAVGGTKVSFVSAPTTCSNSLTQSLCDARAGCMWCESAVAQCYPLGTQCLSTAVPLDSSSLPTSTTPSGFLWDEFYGGGVFLDSDAVDGNPRLFYIDDSGFQLGVSAEMFGSGTIKGGLAWDPLRDRTVLAMDGDIVSSQLRELIVSPMSTFSTTITNAPKSSALSVTGDGNYVYYAEMDGSAIRRATRNGNSFDSEMDAASLSAGEGVAGIVALPSQGAIVAMAKGTASLHGFRRVDSGDDALMVTGAQVAITPESPVMGPGGTLYYFNVDSTHLEFFDPMLTSESYPVIPTVLSERFAPPGSVYGIAFDSLQSVLLVLDAEKIHRVSLPFERNTCLEKRNEADCEAVTGCHWCNIPEFMIPHDSPCVSTTAVCPANFVSEQGGKEVAISMSNYDGPCQLLAPVATPEFGAVVAMVLGSGSTWSVLLPSERSYGSFGGATSATLDHNHKGRVLYTAGTTLCVFSVDDAVPTIPCSGLEVNDDTIDASTTATFSSLCMSGAGGDLYAAAGSSIFKYAYSGGELASDSTPFHSVAGGNTITSMACGASGRVYFTYDDSSTPAQAGVYWVESDGSTVVSSIGIVHHAVELGPDGNLYTISDSHDLVRWDISADNLDQSYVVASGGSTMVLGTASTKIAFHTLSGELLVHDQGESALLRLPFFSNQCSQHHSAPVSCVQAEGCAYCASTKLCVSQTQVCPSGGLEYGFSQEFLQSHYAGDPSGLLVAANGMLVAAVADDANGGGIALVDPNGIESPMKFHSGDVFDLKRDTHPDYPNSMLAMTDDSIVRFELGSNTGDTLPNLLDNTISVNSPCELVQSADGLELYYSTGGELYKAGWDADLSKYTGAVGPAFTGSAANAECLAWDRSSSTAVVCVRSDSSTYTFQRVSSTLTPEDFYMPGLTGVKSIDFGPDGKFYIWLSPQAAAVDKLHVYDPTTVTSTVVIRSEHTFDGYFGGVWNVQGRVMHGTSVTDGTDFRYVRALDAAVGGCVDASEETCNDHIACYWCEAAGACQHSSQLCGELLECSTTDECVVSENFYCDGSLCRLEAVVDSYCDLTSDTCATDHYCDGHNCQPEGNAVVGCDGQTDVCAAGFECCSTLECKETGTCGGGSSDGGDGGSTNEGSSAVGDPHFEGLHGGWFDFHGHADRTYSLVSTPSLQLNAHFVYSDAAYAGTYMDSIGLQLGEHTRIAFHRNGSVAIEPSFTRDATGVMHLAGGGYARSTNETLVVFWDVWRIELNKFWGKRGRQTVHNERAAHVGYRLALDEALLGGAWEALQVHGVHGQTARTLGVVASRGFQGEGVIEGGEADYVVRDGLFGRESTFSLFTGAPATTRMPHEFGTSADGVEAVHHEAVHVSAF